ncbi:MAG TPA: hypothetical protein VLA83_18580 [Candidatus Binatia bacterium]|nr:hypothetical protein [Candidatus Binatia bacterium]
MSRNRLKLIMLCWALLVLAVIWIDRWNTTFAFAELTSVLGVLIVTAGAASTGTEKKDSKSLGLLLLLVGVFLSLMQGIDRFVIGYH